MFIHVVENGQIFFLMTEYYSITFQAIFEACHIEMFPMAYPIS